MSLKNLPVRRVDEVDDPVFPVEDDHARKQRLAREAMLAEEGLRPDGSRMSEEELRQRDAQKVLDALPSSEIDPAVLAEEQARAEQVRRMGPAPREEPLPEGPNPSDYRPAEPENASVVPPAAKPKERAPDKRQAWVCVTDMGIRTGHEVFRSDAHLLGNMVRCPECEGISVRKVEDGEEFS